MARIAFLGSQPGTSPVAGQPLAQVPQVKQLSANSGETGSDLLLLSTTSGSWLLSTLTGSCIVPSPFLEFSIQSLTFFDLPYMSYQNSRR
jgi:hypothetical protein